MLRKKNKDGRFRFDCYQYRKGCAVYLYVNSDFVGRFNGKEHKHGQTLTLELEKVFDLKSKI